VHNLISWIYPFSLSSRQEKQKSKTIFHIFGINSAFFLKAPGEVLPAFFNTPCLRDVTPEFVQTRDAEVGLHETGTENTLCWFCVFIRGRWSPTGWGVINRETGSVRFENIPVGLTGIACITDRSGRMVPCSRMFTVTAGGMEYTGLPGEEISLYLLRKFHVKERMLDIGHTIIGTRIQGANRRDFSDSVTLYTISDTLQVCFQDLVFDNPSGYRYYRLFSPSGDLNIAELEFISERKLPGSVLASPLPVFTKNDPVQKSYYRLRGDTLSDRPGSKLFDADMLTWSAQGWAGMDFGRPVRINRVRIAPRNVHNGIVPGDNYQLFYWNGEWVAAGIQQAEYNFLEYTGVPSNTLYWLKNLDHGEEEQPFFYVNGRQVFCNQPQEP
jgi:hypothetical protein